MVSLTRPHVAPPAPRLSRRTFAAALGVLLLGIAPDHARALTDDQVDASTNTARANCKKDGGTLTSHFEYNADGSVESVSHICVNTPDGIEWNCYTYGANKKDCVVSTQAAHSDISPASTAPTTPLTVSSPLSHASDATQGAPLITSDQP